MNQFAKSLIPAAVAFAIVATPALAFADTNSGTVDATVTSPSMIAFPILSSGVFLGGNGDVIVRGATVESVSGNQITAKSSWGSAILNWVVNLGSAKIFDGSATTSASAIKVGDTVSFAGGLDESQGAFTVNAKTLSDRSLVTPPVATSTPVRHHPEPMKVWDWFKTDLGAHFRFGL